MNIEPNYKQFYKLFGDDCISQNNLKPCLGCEGNDKERKQSLECNPLEAIE